MRLTSPLCQPGRPQDRGFAACMAYAATLREGEIFLSDCPPPGEDQYREKREKLQACLESCGWRALDGDWEQGDL